MSRTSKIIGVALVLGALLVIPQAASAQDQVIEWLEPEAALAKAVEKPRAVIFLLGPSGSSFVDATLAGAFAHKNLLRKADKDQVVFARSDPASNAFAAQLAGEGIASAVVVTDLEGAAVVRFGDDAEVPGPNKILDAVKKAESQGKKKLKVIKKIDKAFPKAEQLREAKSHRGAIELYNWIVAYEGQLLDPRVATSRSRLDALTAVANEKLDDVDDLIRDDDFARAQKALVVIRNEFPIPEVEDAVKQRQEKIARELDRMQRNN